MRRLGTFAQLACLFLPFALVLVHNASAAKPPSPYRILPGPYNRHATPGPDAPTASRFTTSGLTVEVAPLDREERRGFIRKIDPGAGDPFAAPAGGAERYHAFRVAFENESGQDVTFQPGNVVLVTDRKSHQFPIDSPDLYLAASRAGAGDPQAAMDRVSRLIFDSSTHIPAGGRFTRMLVFGPLPDKWKEMRLDFSFLQIGAETRSLSFAFHKQILEGR